MTYRMGDDRDAGFRELRDVLQNMANAAHSGDARVFQAQYGELGRFIQAQGYGIGTGQDISSPLNWGSAAVKSAGGAAKLFLSKMAQGYECVSKSVGPDDAAQMGAELDAAGSDLLMRTARDMAQSGGVSVADALTSICKSVPGLWESHSRHVGGTSAQYWGWRWSIGKDGGDERH